MRQVDLGIPTVESAFAGERRPSKVAKRHEWLRGLAGRTDAPIEWTWQAIIAEERRRTLYNVFLLACYIARSGSLRSRANRLLNLYLLLWRQRSRWCGPIPPRDIVLLASRAPRSVEQQAEFILVQLDLWYGRQLELVTSRLAQVASFALRDPRPIVAPAKAENTLVQRARVDEDAEIWVDVRMMIQREDVDTRRHERQLILALEYEQEKISDRSLRA